MFISSVFDPVFINLGFSAYCVGWHFLTAPILIPTQKQRLVKASFGHPQVILYHFFVLLI